MSGAASLDLVRDMVSAERRTGSKAEVAFEDAAAALGVSTRWVRAVMRGEPAVVKDARRPSFLARYRAWLAADIARSEKLIAERKMLLALMEAADVARDQQEAGSSVAGAQALDAAS